MTLSHPQTTESASTIQNSRCDADELRKCGPGPLSFMERVGCKIECEVNCNFVIVVLRGRLSVYFLQRNHFVFVINKLMIAERERWS